MSEDPHIAEADRVMLQHIQEKYLKLEAENAALRAERDALRYDIAVVTHLVDPGDPLADEKVRQLSRLALSDGLRDQCVVRVDAAEAEAEALRAERDRLVADLEAGRHRSDAFERENARLVAGLTALEGDMRRLEEDMRRASDALDAVGSPWNALAFWANQLAALRRTPE